MYGTSATEHYSPDPIVASPSRGDLPSTSTDWLTVAPPHVMTLQHLLKKVLQGPSVEAMTGCFNASVT